MACCALAVVIPRWIVVYYGRPPVGVYIAVMGLVAAFMAARKDPTGFEKFLWIGLMTILMCVEIANLYRTSDEQARIFSKISGDLDTTKQGLQTTANSLRETAEKISTVETDERGIAKVTRENAATSREALDQMTATNSFPLMQPAFEIPLGTVRLMANIKGSYGLAEFRYSVEQLYDPPSFLAGRFIDVQPEFYLSKTITGTMLPTVLHPSLSEVTHYLIGMSCVCEDGPFTEELDLKVDVKNNVWMYKSWVMDKNRIPLPGSIHNDF